MLAKLRPDRLKMHQKAFGGRASPGPAGELKCSPDPLDAMSGPTSKRKGGKGRG